jgi:hypothetical protein
MPELFLIWNSTDQLMVPENKNQKNNIRNNLSSFIQHKFYVK